LNFQDPAVRGVKKQYRYSELWLRAKIKT